MRKIIPLLLTLLLVSSLVLTAFAVNEIDMTGIVLGKNPEPLDPKVEAMLAWALEIAADDSHGYSQSHRYGPNYDCSSFVCTALMEGGFGLEDYIFPGDMVVILPELGFVAYKKGETEPQRGDILVRPGVHVEICMGGLDCVSAHRDSDRRSGDGNGQYGRRNHDLHQGEEMSRSFCHCSKSILNPHRRNGAADFRSKCTIVP